MKKHGFWSIISLFAAGILLVGCSQGAEKAPAEVPFTLEEIAGSDFKSIELTEKAAERLGIETTSVVEEAVYRQRTVGGEVMTSLGNGASSPAIPVSGSSGSDVVYVRVKLNTSDLSLVDRTQPARILALDDDESVDDGEDEDGLEGEEIEGFDDDDLANDENEGSIYYAVQNNGSTVFVDGQRVRVAVALSGSGAQRLVIPYAAVIYGLHGETWVYTNPSGLTYVRQPVEIDYIEGDLAVLSEGPSAGVQIVTVGASELFGAESGVGGGH